MVGAKDATFFYEGYSEEFAKGINRKVWNAVITWATDVIS